MPNVTGSGAISTNVANRILYLVQNGKMWGEAHSLLRLLDKLDRERFEPVVCCGYEGPLTDKLRERGIPTYIIPTRMWRKGKNFPYVPLTIMRIARLIERERIDLIHNNSFWINPYGAIAGQLTQRPVVTYIRDRITRDKVRKYMFWRTNQFIAVSHGAVQNMREHPVLQDRLEVIYDGLDLAEVDAAPGGDDFRRQWGVQPGETVIGELALYAPRKGQETLIQAGRRLRERGYNIRLVLLGAANPRYVWYDERLRREVEEAGMCDRVIFAGYCEQPFSALKGLDIHVLPTKSEGLALSNLEAMAAGVPCVSSDIPEVREQIDHNKTGLLTPPEDPKALADALATLIDHPDERARLAEGGRRTIEDRFALDRHVASVEAIYARLLKHHGR